MDNLDISLHHAPEEGILVILGYIRPAWERENIVIKRMTGGIINRLYACGLNDDADENDVVIVRVFGSGGDNVIDREKEVLNMRIGYRVGLAAPIYCTFNNGIVYKYQRGCPVDFTNQTEESLAREVARTMAKVHLVDYKKVLEEIGEGDKIHKYTSCFRRSTLLARIIRDVPEIHDDIEKEEIRKAEIMTETEALVVAQNLDREIAAMDFPIVFCHNDFNTGNMVYDKKSNKIHLLDWDMGDVSNGVNDIGVFFLFHAYRSGTVCSPDLYKLYPSKEYQMKWIRWYLEYKAALCTEDLKEVSRDQVERLYKGANLAAMSFVVYLVQWLLIQDVTCTLNHDFFGIARHLQGLYWIIKMNLEDGI